MSGSYWKDLLKCTRVRDYLTPSKKSIVSLCAEYGERRWTKTILVKFIYFGKKLETLISIKKLEKKSLADRDVKILAPPPPPALKLMARQLQSV
jgi:hypothetical protein